MHGPPVVGWLMVGLCAAAATYCLTRAGERREPSPARRRQARGEAVMALGMAVMAVPASMVVLPAWPWWVLAGVFGVVGVRALAIRHPHHAVGSLAMVYMALVMAMATGPAPGGHGEHTPATAGAAAGATAGAPSEAGVWAESGPDVLSGAGGLPLLTGALLAYYAVHAVASGIRLIPGPVAATATPVTGVPRGVGRGAEKEPGLQPASLTPGELLNGCRVAMSLAMFTMLLAL